MGALAEHRAALGAQNGELRGRLAEASAELQRYAAATEGARAAAEEQIVRLERRCAEGEQALDSTAAQLMGATEHGAAQGQELARLEDDAEAAEQELVEMRVEMSKVWIEHQRQARELAEAHRAQVRGRGEDRAPPPPPPPLPPTPWAPAACDCAASAAAPAARQLPHAHTSHHASRGALARPQKLAHLRDEELQQAIDEKLAATKHVTALKQRLLLGEQEHGTHERWHDAARDGFAPPSAQPPGAAANQTLDLGDLAASPIAGVTGGRDTAMRTTDFLRTGGGLPHQHQHQAGMEIAKLMRIQSGQTGRC